MGRFDGDYLGLACVCSLLVLMCLVRDRAVY